MPLAARSSVSEALGSVLEWYRLPIPADTSGTKCHTPESLWNKSPCRISGNPSATGVIGTRSGYLGSISGAYSAFEARGAVSTCHIALYRTGGRIERW